MLIQLTDHTITNNVYGQILFVQRNLMTLYKLYYTPSFKLLARIDKIDILEGIDQQLRLKVQINKRITEFENEAFRYGL